MHPLGSILLLMYIEHEFQFCSSFFLDVTHVGLIHHYYHRYGTRIRCISTMELTSSSLAFKRFGISSSLSLSIRVCVFVCGVYKQIDGCKCVYLWMYGWLCICIYVCENTKMMLIVSFEIFFRPFLLLGIRMQIYVWLHVFILPYLCVNMYVYMLFIIYVVINLSYFFERPETANF